MTVALALALSGCGREEAQEQPAESQQANQVLAGTEPGVTPMAERVAVIGLLNKRNGIVRNLTMRPGQAMRVKDAVVRLQACETTAPWESEKLTGAFIQLEVEGSDGRWRRVFSGWLYKESPSLNVVQHPVYDVWPKSCAMSFPAGPPPPSPPPPSASTSSSSRSSTERSAAEDAPPEDDSAPALEEAPRPAPGPAREVAPPPPSAAANNVT